MMNAIHDKRLGPLRSAYIGGLTVRSTASGQEARVFLQTARRAGRESP